MELINNRCMFSDKQLIRVQETPDEVPEGSHLFNAKNYYIESILVLFANV